MSVFWRRWLIVWCIGVMLFGLVLAGAGLRETGWMAARILAFMSGGSEWAFDSPLRFAVGLMGCVTLGWGATTLVLTRDSDEWGERSATRWRAFLIGVLCWYVPDSVISIANGFGLNAVSNTVLLALLLPPIVATGVLGGGAARQLPTANR